MPKISKAVVDADLRTRIFNELMPDTDFVKINERQYGIILTDLNGTERYVRIGVIVAEERENMTARELMQAEQTAYKNAQDQKTEKARARAEKAEKDKARRKKEGE